MGLLEKAVYRYFTSLTYLNPFTFDQFAFQGSITLISLLNVIIFSQIIEKKFKLKN